MTGFGFGDMIALLLALGGFGVEPNPKPASADVVLEYAVEDADLVGYLDAVPLIPGNYTALKKLADNPDIKSNRELKELVDRATNEVETSRSTVKAMLGIDLTTDLSNATFFLKASTPPEVLVVARGKFPADMATKISKMMGGQTETIGDAQAVRMGGPIEVLAVSKSGVLFAGSRALVTPRVSAGWKPPKRPKGSILADAAKALGDKPVALIAMSNASGRFMKLMETLNGTDDAAMLDDYEYLDASIYANGMGWTIKVKDAAHQKKAVLASEGMIDLMRAFHLGPRGLGKLLVAFLDDIKSTDPEIVELKKHQKQLLGLLEQFTGDGNFKVKWDKSATRVAVRATGKKLSDVVPLGIIVAGGWIGVATKAAKDPPMTQTGPVKTVPPRTGGGIKAPPKKPAGGTAPKPAPKAAHP
jgi:hypothetical protein